MSENVINTKHIKCDRCGFEKAYEETNFVNIADEWGRAEPRFRNGSCVFKADLCFNCCDGLERWYAEGKPK